MVQAIPTLADFQSLSDLDFEIAIDDQRIQAKLTQVSPLAVQADSPCQEPFSLIFEATADHVLPQATYALRHAQLGELSLFMVPRDARENRTILEAVVN